MKKQYLEIGKIVATHALRGEVKIELWCDGTDSIKPAVVLCTESGRTLTLTAIRPHKGGAVCAFEEIKDIDEAMKLKNAVLLCNRADITLPEGKAFIADMLGLPVLDFETGESYGTLSDVLDYGYQKIYEITSPAGKKALMPAVPEFVKKTDIENGIYIKPIPGLFESDGDL